jgi:glucose-6-phosphate 1-dehydrogenase
VPVRGYLEEDGIPADSIADTYAALELGVDTRRWAGCRSTCASAAAAQPHDGDRADVPARAAPAVRQTDTEELGHNALVIRVQPDEG